MSKFTRKRKVWGIGASGASSPNLPSVDRSFERDHVETVTSVRIKPVLDGEKVEIPKGEILHIAAQCLLEGRAQVAEYAASANFAIREILADARARRFEAVQQAKARRIMLQSYREALQRQADAKRILGPHVRFAGRHGRSIWITFFLIGDTAGMTLALTYGGESPLIAALMAVAVGAAVVVCGKTAEDYRRESLLKNLEVIDDPEAKRIVDAVFGVSDVSRMLNRRVLYFFLGSAALPGIAITVYRAVEENILIGLAFGLWATLISAGSFAATWVYFDPAKTYIALTEDTVDDAEQIWRSTEIDAIEEHNSGIEVAKHIVAEHRQRATAAWHMSLANAVAAMSANSEILGVTQQFDNSIIHQQMPELLWPDLSSYTEIVDPDDVHDIKSEIEMNGWPIFANDVTNQIVRPKVAAPASTQ